MATHALGKGTTNFPINLTVAEKRLLGRAAFEADLSLGEYLRRELLTGLHLDNPSLAREIQRIRRQHRALAKGIVLAAALWLVGLTFGDHHPDMRTRPHRTGRRRQEHVEHLEET